MTNLANPRDRDNPATSDDDPAMIIIHCPRVVQVMPWCEAAADMLAWLRAHNWTERRERDAIHVITPMHPAMRQ